VLAVDLARLSSLPTLDHLMLRTAHPSLPEQDCAHCIDHPPQMFS